VINWLLQTLS